MKNIYTIAVVGLGLLCQTAFAQSTFTSKASFEAAINAGYYEDTFASLTANQTFPTYTAAGNTNFSYTASAANRLYSLPGALSTNSIGDSIVFTFSNSNLPVNAFGGQFYNTDVNGSLLTDNVTLAFSDGTTQTYAADSSSHFFGYISKNAITSVSFSPGTATFAYATVNDVVVGSAQAAPEPFSIATLAIGALGLIKKVRKS